MGIVASSMVSRLKEEDGAAGGSHSFFKKHGPPQRQAGAFSGELGALRDLSAGKGYRQTPGCRWPVKWAVLRPKNMLLFVRRPIFRYGHSLQ